MPVRQPDILEQIELYLNMVQTGAVAPELNLRVV